MAETKLIKDYIDRPEDIDRLLMTIDEAKHQDMQEIELLKTKLTELSAKSGGNHDQIAIWKSMIAIFEKKIDIAEKRGVHDGPIGDRY
uniref:Uncharacterized protein n=1 Tax=Panagrolaimus sp. JU765 TaxID=591449 RepID=A0AC34R6U6_9BILA